MAVGSVTWVLRFQNTNWGANQFKGWWGHRADATGNDVVKSMTTLSTAALSHGSTNYSDTGNSKYFSLTRPDWHPTIYVLPLINRALEKCWQWWRSPITMVPDGDMQATAAWSASAGTTVTKSTVRAWGTAIRSTLISNTIATAGAISAAFETEPGRTFRFTAKAYATTGTPRLQVKDAAGNVLATVTADPAVLNTWQELSCIGIFPYTASGGTATVTLTGVESNAVIYFSDAVLVPDLQTRLTLPTWVTQWRTEEGEEALRMYRAVNRLGTVGSWPARSYDMALIDPDDYQVIQSPSSLNPIEIEFGRQAFYTGFPLFVEARRPFSDFGALAADTDVTGAPLRLVVAAAKCLAGLERRELNDRLPLWEHDFMREQQRVASLLQTPTLDNSRGMAWRVLK